MRIFGGVALIFIILFLGCSSVQAGEFYDLLYQRFCSGYSGAELKGCELYLNHRIKLSGSRSYAISNCNGICNLTYSSYYGPGETPKCQAVCSALHAKDN